MDARGACSRDAGQVLQAWGDGTQGEQAALVTLAAASGEMATTLDATVQTLVLSLEASQAAAAAAAASGEALQRMLDGATEAAQVAGVTGALVSPPPPPGPPQTPQCAALPQLSDVKYFVDLSPWIPVDSDSARRRLVRVWPSCSARRCDVDGGQTDPACTAG